MNFKKANRISPLLPLSRKFKDGELDHKKRDNKTVFFFLIPSRTEKLRLDHNDKYENKKQLTTEC